MTERRRALQGLVKGLVQGVFFRAATQREAQRLGVGGWVRNTPAGDVEVCLCGESAAVGELLVWLQHGPDRARVQSVELHPVPDPRLTDFRIRR